MSKERIACRVAKELQDGYVVNLGIGLPTMVSDYLEGKQVFIQSENGLLGMGGVPHSPEELDPDIVNAGGQPVTLEPGAMFFDSSLSFAIIRGGHVDVCVLGAFEADQEGSLASYVIPGGIIAGMGGAMDLVAGSQKVIVGMLHTNKGKPKIVEKCSLPLTGYRRVNLIISEMAVLEVGQQGLLLRELHPDYSLDELHRMTAAPIVVAEPIARYRE